MKKKTSLYKAKPVFAVIFAIALLLTAIAPVQMAFSSDTIADAEAVVETEAGAALADIAVGTDVANAADSEIASADTNSGADSSAIPGVDADNGAIANIDVDANASGGSDADTDIGTIADADTGANNGAFADADVYIETGAAAEPNSEISSDAMTTAGVDANNGADAGVDANNGADANAYAAGEAAAIDAEAGDAPAMPGDGAPNVQNVRVYPVTVLYYKDEISDSNFINQVALRSAPEGSVIRGIDATLFAPPGYTTPGEVSGDAKVKPPYALVYVLYTRPVPQYPTYVFYYRDVIGGDYLGFDILPDEPLGSPITGVDATLYAPPGYDVPGAVSGDTEVKAPYSVVYVVYTKPIETTPIFVIYFKDRLNGVMLGTDYIETVAPEGTPVSALINRYKYLPPGYPGANMISGDKFLKKPITIVYIVYNRIS